MGTELLPFDLGLLLAETDGTNNLALKPLDEVHIFSKWNFTEKPAAMVIGKVRLPGTYDIDGMKIRDLLFKAGGLEKDAFLGIGHLYRTDKETMEITIHSFDVSRALAGDRDHNLVLQDRDQLVIHDTWDYSEKYTVSVHGEVNKPGAYPHAGNMTVRDLILLAGSVKESAYLENGELVRFDIVDGKRVQTSLLVFDVNKALNGDAGQNYNLQPWDIVNIKKIAEWGDNKEVYIEGEVLFPGTYSIRKGENLSSLVARAGGYTDSAYFRGAVFTRESVRILQQQRLEELIDRLAQEMSQQAASELAGALSTEDVQGEKELQSAQQSLINRLRTIKANGRVVIRLTPGPAFEDSNYNIVLEDQDRLLIPPKPDTVSVAGEIYNATSLIFDSGRPEVGYYLDQTGGPTKYANPKEMFILRADGTVLAQSRPGFSPAFASGFEDTSLYPGDTLVVPPKILHTRLKRDIKDITSIIYEIAVSAGIIINLFF
jgi:protein involved in polysaccharide export with SLBB domain